MRVRMASGVDIGTSWSRINKTLGTSPSSRVITDGNSLANSIVSRAMEVESPLTGSVVSRMDLENPNASSISNQTTNPNSS